MTFGGGRAPTRGGSGERGGEGQGAAAARPARLPDLMHITQTAQVVSFEDSSGTVVQEITTLGGAPDSLAHAPGAQVVSGEWKDGTLEVSRKTPSGAAITQTYSLEKEGKELVISTAMPAFGDRPGRTFKRVYQKVSD